MWRLSSAFYNKERGRDMAGLGVLILVGLYFFIAYQVVKALKTKASKSLAIAILVLIPTVDAIVGRFYLQHLCATEGGLKVYRVAQGVEGFIGAWGESDMAVEKYGYKYSESAPVNGRVNRYSKDNGQVVKEKDVLPKSNYRVRYLTTGRKDIFMRQTLIVETVSGGEVLATDAQIGFNGGWAERFLAQFSGAGGGAVVWCESKDILVRYRELIVSSLKN